MTLFLSLHFWRKCSFTVAATATRAQLVACQDLCPSMQSGQGCVTATGPRVPPLAAARASGPPHKTHLVPVVSILQMTIGGEMTVEHLEKHRLCLLMFVW